MQFKFKLVPSDMKWLATFAGELSNAAHYFSTFANVHEANKNTVNGSIGEGERFTWQPWKYNDRLSVASRVKAKQNELDATHLQSLPYCWHTNTYLSRPPVPTHSMLSTNRKSANSQAVRTNCAFQH